MYWCVVVLYTGLLVCIIIYRTVDYINIIDLHSQPQVSNSVSA